MLGLRCFMGSSVVAMNWGHPEVVVHGLPIAWASLIAQHRLQAARLSLVVAPGIWSMDSVVIAHGLSCSVACGIFLDWGSNPCLLH